MCVAEKFTRQVGRVFLPFYSTQQIIYSPWRAVEWNCTPLNVCLEDKKKHNHLDLCKGTKNEIIKSLSKTKTTTKTDS
jgi:hypothetical protein